MSGINPGQLRPRLAGLAVAVVLAVGLAACGSDQAPPPEATAPVDAVAAEQRAAREQARQDQLAAMSTDELREAASSAYADSRLYAPVGDNALEYYLALRERQPGDASVSSALTDLLPMTVIATEQGRDRGDFEEARRLHGLIQRASPQHPALSRLEVSIDEAEQANVQRLEQQRQSAEQEAQRQRELEVERQRQQQQAQEDAARLAREEAEREAAEREAAERRAAEQREAERLAAERRAAEQQAAAAAAAAAAAQAAATPTAADLRPISTPPPRYPPDALRAGQSGEVLVEFTVNPDGSVANPRVVRADPPRVFDREAVAAVRRWRFEPVAAPVTTRRMIGFDPEG